MTDMTTTIATTLNNPMWDEIAQHVKPGTYRYGPARGIPWTGVGGVAMDRFLWASKFAWTVTAPDTVAFVAEHLGSSAIDPLAGSGYWAYLLGQAGIDVLATDRDPAGEGSPNTWHEGASWLPVARMDGVASVARASSARSLLLSWPPYDDPIGAQILARYEGDRLVYVGELDGGCCGDDDLFAALGRDWDMVAEHEPVQWFGMHDYVQAYVRKR